MKRPVSSDSHSVACRGTGCQPVLHGFTLVEILVATTLALLLMGAVAVMFGRVAESITDSRSMLEAADRLRLAETRLQMDLAGITATVCPPLKPENNEGYFEYIEGPVGTDVGLEPPTNIAVNSDNGNQPDPTVGDFDDILMFTTRTTGKPFVGRYGVGATIQSDVAEVAWFLRGRTLHRRVLLVAPNVDLTVAPPTNYYRDFDISARLQGVQMKANTLGDLTRRECRFAHPAGFPYDVRRWQWTVGTTEFPTLPTLKECSSTGWTTEQTPSPPYPVSPLDMWTNAVVPDDAFVITPPSTRVSDDVILTNVIGFDVKAWDPEQGAYKDLGHQGSIYGPNLANGLSHLGNPASQLHANASLPSRVYDTWSTTYFGSDWNNGIDDDGDGIVDDADIKAYDPNPIPNPSVYSEILHPPPYPIPLRGIQVKIRVFEPDSRQIREVTVVHEFLPR